MWAQTINMLLGLWLMAAPGVLGYGRPASTSDHIVGPLVATFACVAIWEATRSARWFNLPLGIWVLATPWFLGHPPNGQLSSVLCGTAIALLSCSGSKVRQQFGGGWAVLGRSSRSWQPNQEEPRP
jgi:hypothetical protein